MKKVLLFGLIGLGVLAALGTTGMVYAQTIQPPTQTPGAGQGTNGYGWGFVGGMMGGWAQTGNIDGYGPMHDDMIAAFASSLGMTVDEVNAKLASGKTLYQIALDAGKTSTEAQTLIINARNTALDQLVADGVLTSAQAQWMKDHMAQMSQYGFGPGYGGCGGYGGMMGGFFGGSSNSGTNGSPSGSSTGPRGGMMRNGVGTGRPF